MSFPRNNIVTWQFKESPVTRHHDTVCQELVTCHIRPYDKIIDPRLVKSRTITVLSLCQEVRGNTNPHLLTNIYSKINGISDFSEMNIRQYRYLDEDEDDDIMARILANAPRTNWTPNNHPIRKRSCCALCFKLLYMCYKCSVCFREVGNCCLSSSTIIEDRTLEEKIFYTCNHCNIVNVLTKQYIDQ